MEIVTLIYLSGAITGTVMGETFKPLSLPIDDANVIKECTVKTTKSKVYNKDIKDYIENEFVEETCKTSNKPPDKPIINAIKNKITP